MSGNITNQNALLTKKQAHLLHYIHDFRENNGDGPTMVMMVKNLGLGSNRSVIDMLRLLVANGYLKQATKISRSTILTSKALIELNLIRQPQFIPTRPYISPISTFTSLSAQQTNPSKDSGLSWNNIPQPGGSQAGGFSHDITKLLSNAISLLAYNGTGLTKTASKSEKRLNPLIFLIISSIIIFLMFGNGIKSAVLIIILMLIISIRSTR